MSFALPKPKSKISMLKQLQKTLTNLDKQAQYSSFFIPNLKVPDPVLFSKGNSPKKKMVKK